MKRRLAVVMLGTALCACTVQGTLSTPQNSVPSIEILSPDPADGPVPTDTSVAVEAVVDDFDDLASELVVTLTVADDVFATDVPADDGTVRFDWRTPDVRGPVEVTVSAMDSIDATDSRTVVFWVSDVAPEDR